MSDISYEISMAIGKICMAAISICFVWMMYEAVIRKKISGDRQKVPEIHTRAVMVYKTQKTRETAFGTISDCWLEFEFSNGARKAFLVGASTYNNTQEGEAGMLTYKQLGNTGVFVSFRPAR